MRRLSIAFMLAILTVSNTYAVELGTIFTDNMVLQQQSKPAVWGRGDVGERIVVTASWNKRSYHATTDSNGRWRVEIETPAAGGPYSLSVRGRNAVQLSNIYLGEVWLASGQSNMSMPLKGYFGQPVEGSLEAIMASGESKIHFLNIDNLASFAPLERCESSGWVVASTATAGECSATAWFFAEMLHRQLGVPIGIINASYGGSNIEAWMPEAACRRFADMNIPQRCDSVSKSINGVETTLYNAMINPIAGYGMRGMIWYQGESNVFNVPRYRDSMIAFVEELREIWGADFPFYFAQIAPYDYREWNTFRPRWPEISAYLREAQLQASNLISNCAMAVLMDAGEEFMIHPRSKKIAGNRLALLAMDKTYAETGFEAESPVYDRFEIKEDKIEIFFANAPLGITSYGRSLNLFEIAGENRVLHKADAHINEQKGTITLSSKYIDKPIAARYAFRNFVVGEIFGTGGLPVSSFRTDDWDQ